MSSQASSIASSSRSRGGGKRGKAQHPRNFNPTATPYGSNVRRLTSNEPLFSQNRVSPSSLFPARPQRGTSLLTQVPPPTSSSEQQLKNIFNGISQIDDETYAESLSSPEIIMALDMKENSTMGCSYFTTELGGLYVSEDLSMADIDIAEQFIILAQPTTILVSARCPEKLLEFLERRSTSSPTGDAVSGFVLRRLQSSEFSLQVARNRLFDISVDPARAVFTASGGSDGQLCTSDSDYDSLRESRIFKSIRCGGSVNLNSHVSVGCAGAVLGDLHCRRSAGFLPDGQAAEAVFHIDSLQMFSLSDYMFINGDTLQSLQIVQTELHPNSQTWGPDSTKSGTKESLSVYGLFYHLACTPQGKSRLRQLFLRPTMDMGVIAERLQTISTLLQPNNAEKLHQSTFILRKIRNLRATISHLKRGVNSPSAGQSFNTSVWSTVRTFAAQILKLKETVATFEGGDELDIVRKILSNIHTREFVAVGEMIDKTIDFERSSSRARSSVKAGVDPQLDELKRTYDGLDSLLLQVKTRMCHELPGWASQYVRLCLFWPQIGFLTQVDLDPHTGNGRYQGEYLERNSERDSWDQIFVYRGDVYYRNGYTRELDEQYGDIFSQIGDREIEIIHDLAQEVLKYEDVLVSASDICGEFDAISALALGADKYRWRAPRVVEENVVQIDGGRHPLQELVVSSFIPNDCYLGDDSESDEDADPNRPQALVLTGPNHSGKSVYLKQVAIIVYLSHIGSFVPANKAVIGLTDKILTRISTRESMSGGESAFAIDLKQVALSTRCSTSRSLILVDEFGKGTNADDGAGLIAALLDHFLSLEQNSPKLLVATHFHEVFRGGYLSRHGERILLAHMDVRVDREAVQVEDQVSYLFKLTRGHSTSSLGSVCAALNGVPSAVVERAESIAKLLSQNEDLSIINKEMSGEERKNLERAESVARKFVGQDFHVSDNGEDSMKAILSNILA